MAFRKVKLKFTDVCENSLNTDFYGIDLTRDKLQSLIRKWQSIIETNIDVKAQDGCFFRVFLIAFSKRTRKQHKKTSYLNASQLRTIRRKSIEIINKETNELNLKDLVDKFLSDKIAKEIERVCKTVFPLHNIYIRKIKVLGN